MNPKGIAVVAGIIAVILLVVLLPKAEDVPPPIIDSIDVVDDTSIEKESRVTDTPDVSDTAVTENDEELDYYIDENGTKHYRLEVRDAPTFES